MSSKTHFELQCEEYLRGELSSSALKAFEKELSTSPELREKVDELREYFEALTLIRPTGASADFTDVVMQRIAQKRKPWFLKMWGWVPVLPREAWGLAATAVLVVGLIVPQMHKFSPEESYVEESVVLYSQETVEEKRPQSPNKVVVAKDLERQEVESPNPERKPGVKGFGGEASAPLAQDLKESDAEMPPAPKPLRKKEMPDESVKTKTAQSSSPVVVPVEEERQLLEKIEPVHEEDAVFDEVVHADFAASAGPVETVEQLKKLDAPASTVASHEPAPAPAASEVTSYGNTGKVEVGNEAPTEKRSSRKEKERQKLMKKLEKLRAKQQSSKKQQESVAKAKRQKSSYSSYESETLQELEEMQRNREPLFPFTFTDHCDTLEDGTYRFIVSEEKYEAFLEELKKRNGEVISQESMYTRKSYKVRCRW